MRDDFLQLARRLLEAQIELLFLQRGDILFQCAGVLIADGFDVLVCHDQRPSIRETILVLHRQLGRAEAQAFARDRIRHAVDFEHDPAWRDARGPKFRRALTFTHADFDRLL